MEAEFDLLVFTQVSLNTYRIRAITLFSHESTHRGGRHFRGKDFILPPPISSVRTTEASQ